MPQIVINTHRSPRFVNVGEDRSIIPHRGWIGHRQWEGNRHYGFVSAGQGTVYSNPFRNLEIGDVVFAFISGEGYVGVGVVNQRAVPIRNFNFGGLTLRDLDVDDRIITAQEVSYDFVPQLTSIRKTLFRNANNDELTDYAVGVEWLRTVPRNNAYWVRGVNLLATMLTSCTLRNQPRTIQFVEENFNVRIFVRNPNR